MNISKYLAIGTLAGVLGGAPVVYANTAPVKQEQQQPVQKQEQKQLVQKQAHKKAHKQNHKRACAKAIKKMPQNQRAKSIKNMK